MRREHELLLREAGLEQRVEEDLEEEVEGEEEVVHLTWVVEEELEYRVPWVVEVGQMQNCWKMEEERGVNQNLMVVEVASCHREVEVVAAPEEEPQLDGLEKKASLVELEEDDWGLKDCYALEAHHQIH